MKPALRKRAPYIIVAILIIIGVTLFIKNSNDAPNWTTDTMSVGNVRNLISVSGSVEAVDSADLAFPVSGIVDLITIREGDSVTAGQRLMTLVHNDLLAEYDDARGALLIAQADRDELVAGITPEARTVGKTEIEIAKENLVRVTAEHDERVSGAYRTLLSSDLEAIPEKKDNEDTPPSISGSYTCDEGTYTLETYPSGAQSGYSYNLSGIERGTFTTYTESPAPLGTCGLSIQFADEVSYGNATWFIEIPNTHGASYIENKNTYDLAITDRSNAIRAAEQALTLAEQTHALDTATPRTEARTREDAKILQAQARLDVIASHIHDHQLYAPFAGTITSVEPVTGETVGTEPVITMVANNTFALTALIPEIDVIKIRVGQKAEIVFDARQDERLPASVIFISPLAKEIDGVSYFEAKLTLDTPVDWLRSGLNADIDIIIDAHENVTRIPKRYLTEENGTYSVLVPNGKETASKSIEVIFTGNDGYVEIRGLTEGDTIVAP